MQAKPDLHFAFDVGHSSIGWAVMRQADAPDLLGCGTVTFGADDCLASQRRSFRRQRRHIRSTRQRIARLKTFLRHLGVLTQEQLDSPGCKHPFLIAAEVLSNGRKLTWPEMWDVLRWYSHNRGYDGNRRWSYSDPTEAEDAEKVVHAQQLRQKHGTTTMAETMAAHIAQFDKEMAAWLRKREPGKRPNRLKALNAAFERDVVEGECRQILEAHIGKLPKLTASVVGCIMDDFQIGNVPGLKIPKRYVGGLLFGQLVPRFDNRIISTCPISGEKVPTRECVEFYRFRWGMTLANIRVAESAKGELRGLSAAEKQELDQLMREQGALTPTELKNAVRKLGDFARDNLANMLLHPDMKEALVLDPVQKLITSEPLSAFWSKLPEPVRKRATGKWRRGKKIQIRDLLDGQPEALAALEDHIATQSAKGRAKRGQLQEILAKTMEIKRLSGRAPYSRKILQQVYDDVLAKDAHHPKEVGGVLYLNEDRRRELAEIAIDKQTNNHLVRHRLKILTGDPRATANAPSLFRDLLQTYANGDKTRVARITVEVNRDLRELSGKTNKEKAQEMGLRLKNFKSVEARLKELYPPSQVRPSLIRKARVLEDLGGQCPYTGKEIDLKDLANPHYVDKDHIIPYSQRPSDSLESLVITFKAVNLMKKDRTALEFVEQEQGKPVPGMPNVQILSLAEYRQRVEKLKSPKGHDDDARRQKKRKALMLLPTYVEKEFTPGDLTKTSQLVRLATQSLSRQYLNEKTTPVITSMPGQITAIARKSWKLLGCLATANPNVLDDDGQVRTKTEIREITHLHHALDACILALATHYLGRDGSIWSLLVKRKLTQDEQKLLKEKTGGLFVMGGEGRDGSLKNLPDNVKEQIRQRLAECRVVQHIPKSIDGLRVEQNAWRVRRIEGDTAHIEQRNRQPDQSRPLKRTTEKVGKLLGLFPNGTGQGKLKPRQSVLVIPENFGIALDPTPTIIPYHKVWNRIQELKAANGGKTPRILRNGQVFKVRGGNFAGVWRVFSVKNNATGLALDIGRPDVVRLKNGTEGHKINVRVASLLAGGLTVLGASLCES